MIHKKIFKQLLIIISLLYSNNLFSMNDIIFVVQLSKEGVDYYVSRGAKENRDVDAVFSFLREEFNSTVVYRQEDIKSVLSNSKTVKNVVYVSWEIGTFKRDIGAVGRYPMKLMFLFSDETNLIYDCSVNVNGYTYDLKMAILRALKKNVLKDQIYERISSLNLNSDLEILSKNKLDSLSNSLVTESKSIVGIYKLISSSNFTSLGTIGVFQDGQSFILVNIESSAFIDDWKTGQLIGRIEKTASSKYFIGKYRGIIGGYDEVSILYEDNMLDLIFTKNKNSRKFIKIK